jgi:hypothetical protein
VKLAPLFALACVACGGGPQLSNLRCRNSSCQDAEDPLKVLLAVDFDDESGTLSQGVLDLRLGGVTQSTVSLADIFAAQNLDVSAKKGTLAIDDDMQLGQLNQGEQVEVSLVATDGQGKPTNEPSITFNLKLGGN